MSRTWLVTGASRGLGRAIAEAALRAGNRVVVTARQTDTVADLVAAHPDRARAVALDVTNRDQARAAVRAAIDAFGGLDVLVNNAGYANVNSIEDFDEDDFRAQIETNLWGVITMTRAALPVMREQGGGHIIQISSVGGRSTTPGIGPYQTAKWAVEGFSGVLSQEVGPLGIRVTIIEPGGFRTDWAGSSMTVHTLRDAYRPTVGAIADYRERHVPIGDPEKAARVIVDVAGTPDPPLRLLLGSDAYAVARAADEAKIASDERWKELTLSTDHDDADANPAPRGHAAGAPIVFVATNRLKPGALDAERARVPDLVEFVRDHEPRVIAFHEFVDPSGTETTVVQVHPDVASLQTHFRVIRERASDAYGGTIEDTVRVQIFGLTDDRILDALRSQTGDSTDIVVSGEYLGGFSRGPAVPT